MNTDWIRGVIPPIVTPVDADDRVDEPALRRVVDHVIAGGVHGISAWAATVSSLPSNAQEQQRAVAITVSAANGASRSTWASVSITTRDCLKLARVAEKEKVQAIAVPPPMFLSRPATTNSSRTFRAVAESTPLPVLLYNNPERMKASISADVVARAAAIPNIVGIKDSSGDMTRPPVSSPGRAQRIRISRSWPGGTR